MSFTWGTVTAVSPLRIQLDGDTVALPFAPDSLVDPLTLAVGDRVRCELSSRRVIIVGRSGGPRPMRKSFPTKADLDAFVSQGWSGLEGWVVADNSYYVWLSGTWKLWGRALTSYVPTVSSGLTLGNGTWSCDYAIAGGVATLRWALTLGSTSSVTGPITTVLPVFRAAGAEILGVGRAVVGAELPLLLARLTVFALAVSASDFTTFNRWRDPSSSYPPGMGAGTVLTVTATYPI